MRTSLTNDNYVYLHKKAWELFPMVFFKSSYKLFIKYKKESMLEIIVIYNELCYHYFLRYHVLTIGGIYGVNYVSRMRQRNIR